MNLKSAFLKFCTSFSASTVTPFSPKYEPNAAWGNTTPASSFGSSVIYLSMKSYSNSPTALHTTTKKSISCSFKVWHNEGYHGPSCPSQVNIQISFRLSPLFKKGSDSSGFENKEVEGSYW